MKNENNFRIVNDRILINLKIIPGSAKNMLSGFRNGEIILKIKARPEKGKANKMLIAFISRQIGCPKSSMEITRGHTSRHKTLAVPLSCRNKIPVLIQSVDS